jgi:phosphoglycerol transferase MdoB-like AlkP superfamily enzyme
MKRLGLFVVALVFAFCTTVMAADKPAVAQAKDDAAVSAEKADVKADVVKAKAAKKAAKKKAKAAKKAAKKKAAEKKASDEKVNEAAEPAPAK